MPSPLVNLLTDKFFVYFARMHKYLLKLAIDINIKTNGESVTDKEALELVVRCHNTVNDNTMGVIINLNNEVIAEDKISAKLANIPGESHLGRKFMMGIDWRSDIIVKNLELCCNTRRTQKWLSLRFSRQPEYWLITLRYMPLINLTTNNVIGYKILGEKMDDPLTFYNFGKVIESTQGNSLLSDQHNIKSNEAIKDAILFLIFHCENYQQVADLLSLIVGRSYTKSMVSKVVSRTLYPQFGVVNLESLKAAAHKQGYHKHLPTPLLGEFMFPLDKL